MLLKIAKKWITCTEKIERYPDEKDISTRTQKIIRCVDTHRGLCQPEDGEGINTRNWVDSTQGRDYWRALVNVSLNHRVS